MRVIAGSLKGRRLKGPTWSGLRPTSDKLRETLFNVLAPRIAGARVLDAFAGTGALGIEAFSRGAATVTFIDGDRRAQALIAENLALCRIASGCAIIRASVGRTLATLRSRSAFVPFDIVLLDPPYDQLPEEILKDAEAAVAPAGVVVLEHARFRLPPESTGRLVRSRLLWSGDSALSIYTVGRGKER